MTHGSLLCGHCQYQAPPITRCIAAFRYQEPIAKLIQLAKYRSRLDILTGLGLQLAEVIIQHQHAVECSPGENECLWPQALIPVPLHYRRLCYRGYNQSVELARVLSRQLNLPLLRHSSRRIRPTTTQTRLDTRQRRNNIRHAFRVNSKRPLKHVAIIDDVMTSGQTVYELAKTLRNSGVHRVDAWVLARAYDHTEP
ncbi:MAG TPA: ComF family protein [Gammaproteobacteria bacterium]|nr:ComF family protein [Gammaproteobacteria bacterium]